MKSFATKLFIFAALLSCIIMQPQLHAQQCAPAHHINPPILVQPDTIRDWHPEEMPCFGNTICSDFQNPFAEIVNFNSTPSLVGQLAIITTGHPTSAQTALTIMSRDCDTILARKCLNYPIDTLQFYSTTDQFSLWFQCEYDTFELSYMAWKPTGALVVITTPIPCATPTSINTTIPTSYTYAKFDAIRGTTATKSSEQPNGLSIRSDGAKVFKQGASGGLVLLLVLAAIICVMLDTIKATIKGKPRRE